MLAAVLTITSSMVVFGLFLVIAVSSNSPFGLIVGLSGMGLAVIGGALNVWLVKDQQKPRDDRVILFT